MVLCTLLIMSTLILYIVMRVKERREDQAIYLFIFSYTEGKLGFSFAKIHAVLHVQ